MIAGKKQRPTSLVKDRKGEDTLESLCELGDAPLFVAVNQHFGVASGRKAMPESAQFFTQCAVVVDFPVEDGQNAAILVRDRLISGVQVDYREASVAEPAALIGCTPLPLTIRPSMLQCVEHARGNQGRKRRAALGRQRQVSCDSTHSLDHFPDRSTIERAASCDRL